jgi:hypothetical protein
MLIYTIVFVNCLHFSHKTLKNTPQIKLDAIIDVLQKTGVQVDVDELTCILANLIVQKKMKGYISYAHQTIVLSKVSFLKPLLKFNSEFI